MAKFYVGQRVRCVHSETGKHQGKEGVVINTNFSGPRTCGDFITNGLRVQLPCQSLPVLSDSWRWEPILYDGNQLVSLEECLWQPEGQAA